MSGDYSRVSFDPRRDFFGVLMQQGCVQLDADWNELVAELTRRIQTGTLDTLGAATVPVETPQGFEINATNNALRIGRGRIYVDGILAENHGSNDAVEWNPHVAEMQGGPSIDYAAQPYYPNPPGLPSNTGPHLVYLDVWQRELTAIDIEEKVAPLVEAAIGVDTTTRIQTVWQVKVLPNVGDGVTCGTPLVDVPGFKAKHPGAAGRLKVELQPDPSTDTPCFVPPASGYKGLENQLYRVEIHDGGVPGVATFKWSRDNASVATRITSIGSTRDTLVVESLGRDDVLGFHEGDWVEITDDWHELQGLPGFMRRITIGGGIDEPTRTITLNTPLPTGEFANTEADIKLRNTRLRRWDQSGDVRRADGSTYVDLDASTTGVITVPATTGVVSLFLESGILVTFTLDTAVDPGRGQFRTGDYWVVAARTATGKVDLLDRAPPRGIHHHFCKLAIVTFPNGEQSCRQVWPPKSEQGCDCSVCVSADDHNSGRHTLKQAVDAVHTDGGTICLGIGTYQLPATLDVRNRRSLRIRGQGAGTKIVRAEGGPAIAIDESVGITLERMVIGAAATNELGGTITVHNSGDVTVRDCAVLTIANETRNVAAITLDGALFGVRVERCAILGPVGCGRAVIKGDGALSLIAGLTIRDNVFFCRASGIQLDRSTLLALDTRISSNVIGGCSEVGIGVVGSVLEGSRLDVIDNLLEVTGAGIAVGVDGARIEHNDIRASTAARSGDGIVMVPGFTPGALPTCRILDNRVSGTKGDAIALRAPLVSVMIKGNSIQDINGSGLLVDAPVTQLSVDNNQFRTVAVQPASELAAAIRIAGAERVEVVNNLIDGAGQNSLHSWGVLFAGCRIVRTVGNSILRVGPDRPPQVPGGHMPEVVMSFGAAIEVTAPWEHADVVNVEARRNPDPAAVPGAAAWYGFLIGEARPGTFVPFGKRLAVFTIADGSGFVLAGNTFHRFAPTLRRSVALRGNLCEARSSRTPVVQVGDAATILLAADNRLYSDTQVDSLRFAGQKYVVIGNVTTGPILVGDPLNPGGVIPLPPASPLNIGV